MKNNSKKISKTFFPIPYLTNFDQFKNWCGPNQDERRKQWSDIVKPVDLFKKVRNGEDCSGYVFMKCQDCIPKKTYDIIQALWEEIMTIGERKLRMPDCLCYVIFNENAAISYTGKLF